MQFERIIIKYGGFERAGGFQLCGRPGLKRAGGDRHPNGNLLLQPEPVRRGVA